MDNSVLGVWKLRSFTMENVDTKERSEPFGPAPRGRLILEPGGHMAVLFTAGKPAGSATDASQPGAAQQLMAYSGHFRLEAPDRLITSVDVASFGHWVDTEQVRTYRLDGDRLEIFTPTGRMPQPGGGEATVFGTLSWTREAPTPVEEPGRTSG